MDAAKHYDLQTSLSYILNAYVSEESLDMIRQKFGVASDDEIKMRKFMEMVEYLEQPEQKATHDNSGNMHILNHKNMRQTIASKLDPAICHILGLDGSNGVDLNDSRSRSLDNACDEDFESAYEPSEMRSLALFASDGMEETLRHFLQANKNLLKKFRLTGGQSALAMLEIIYYGDNDVHCGPWVEDEEINDHPEPTSNITRGTIGGIIFFEDPMANLNGFTYDPDLDSLCQQALVKNLIVTNTPSSALMLTNTLRTALKETKGELIPSFFFSLQHPDVIEYQLDRGKAGMDFEPEFLKLQKKLESANREKDQLRDELVHEKSAAAANYKELASIVEGIMDAGARDVPQLLRRLQDKSSPLTVIEDVSPVVGGLEIVVESDEKSVDGDNDHDTASMVYDFARPDDSLSVSSRPMSRQGRSAGRKTPAFVLPSTDSHTNHKYYDGDDGDDDDGSVMSISTYKSVASIRRESARENLKKRFSEFMKKHGEKEHNEGELLRVVSNMQPF
jgi:methylglyoxal synthase